MAKKPNKFHAKKTVFNGQTFDSKKEAAYAAKLEILKRSFKPSDKVIGYRTQVPFPVHLNGKLICTYKLDFLTTYADGRIEHVDVKGYKKGAAYQVFRIKKKLVEAQYNIEIIEK
jgi:hypothetical protein